jgi:hypothetical protein
MVKFLQDTWHQWDQLLDSVAGRFYNEYGYRKLCEILLKLKVLIHCQEDVELDSRKGEQLSVLDSCPPASRHSSCLMSNKQGAQTARQILVKQDAHQASRQLSPVRVPQPPGHG